MHELHDAVWSQSSPQFTMDCNRQPEGLLERPTAEFEHGPMRRFEQTLEEVQGGVWRRSKKIVVYRRQRRPPQDRRLAQVRPANASRQGRRLGQGQHRLPRGQLASNRDGCSLLDRTNFYAEQGGQVGDIGRITADGMNFDVEDTQRLGDSVLHSGVLTDGTVTVGQEVTADRYRSHRHRSQPHRDAPAQPGAARSARRRTSSRRARSSMPRRRASTSATTSRSRPRKFAGSRRSSTRRSCATCR